MKLSQHRLFLMDMDGTLYLDNDLFDGALEFLDYVKKIGGKYMFLTNNSSKGIEKYIEKMQRFGVDANADDFFTSTEATIWYLKKPENLEKYNGKKIYAMGTASFCKQMRDAGFDIVTDVCDDVALLLVANDQELTFKKLDDACILLGRGVDFLATNPDWVCPTWYGYVPDCGSFCEMLYRATGRRAKFIGKPEPDMALICMDRLGYSKEETVIIGDRIYTDIACGVNAGCTSILVLSGETKYEDIKNYDITPTYVMDDIRQVLNEMKKQE